MNKTWLLNILELIRKAHSVELEIENGFRKINADTTLFLWTEEWLLDMARLFDPNLTNELERFLYEAGWIWGPISWMIELDWKETRIESLDDWLELMIAIDVIEKD